MAESLIYILIACLFSWAFGTHEHFSFKVFVVFMLSGIFNQVVQIRRK